MTERRGVRWTVCRAPLDAASLLNLLHAFVGGAGKVTACDDTRWFIALPGDLSGLSDAENAAIRAARRAECRSQDAARWFELTTCAGGYAVHATGSADAFTRAVAAGLARALQGAAP